jgi:hypothetical protein
MDINSFMALTMDDFEAMTIAQLEEAQIWAGNFREALKDQARLLTSVFDVKLERAKILKMFENLSNDQKRDLVQAISDAGGIESNESVVGL